MSSLELHREAENEMALADMAGAAGKPGLQKAAWRKAAEHERLCFDEISVSLRTTRGITAVSAVALAKRSGDDALARDYAEYFQVSAVEVPTWALLDIRDIIEKGVE